MRIYQLTDRDFEEFFAIIEKVESELRARHEDARVSNRPLGAALGTYRYRLIGWRNQMMRGDTFDSQLCVGPPTEGWINKEIARLQRMLPDQAG